MLTQERLSELLEYDKHSGQFYWKMHRRGKVKTGDAAGSIRCNKSSGKMYIVIGIDNRLYFGHRLAWLITTGSVPTGVVDHIDGNGTNNRIENLREVSTAENQRNLKKRSDNLSGVTGVHFSASKQKWIAQIKVNRKSVFIGSFNVFNEAVEARKIAEHKYSFHKNHGSNRPSY